MAKVSVIIPTHNRPERLGHAIRSVLDQTEKDLEIFVVDDGSADHRAADVVRASGDPRLQYIRLALSSGPAAARNAGIAAATSPYVAFLDDDDEWLPEKLERQMAALEHAEARVALSYTARITVDRVTGKEMVTRFPEPFDRASGLNVITLSSVLVRRACLDHAGYFDEQLFGTEDYDLWIRLGAEFRFQYMDAPLVRYFIHGDGISHCATFNAGSSGVRDRNMRSLERMLVKHREVFEANRRGHCLSYVALAAKYRRIGDLRKERGALWRALRIWPFEPRAYWALMWSFARRAGVGAISTTPKWSGAPPGEN